MASQSRSELDFTALLRSMLNSVTETSYKPLGGYPELLFLDLSDKEKEEYRCNICFLIAKDSRICSNKHLFCTGCILRWVMTDNNVESKCPVCRTTGKYERSIEMDKNLLERHVKCPNNSCSWAGKLKDYNFHSKSHPIDKINDTTKPKKKIQSSQTTLSRTVTNRHRLESLMESFQEDLLQRRQNIRLHQVEQERQRQESLAEVNRLDQELGNVSDDLNHLLNNMQQDNQRYQRYVNEAQNLLPLHLADSVNQPFSMEEARVERILASSNLHDNPFTAQTENIQSFGSRNSGRYPSLSTVTLSQNNFQPLRPLPISTRGVSRSRNQSSFTRSKNVQPRSNKTGKK